MTDTLPNPEPTPPGSPTPPQQTAAEASHPAPSEPDASASAPATGAVPQTMPSQQPAIPESPGPAAPAADAVPQPAAPEPAADRPAAEASGGSTSPSALPDPRQQTADLEPPGASMAPPARPDEPSPAGGPAGAPAQSTRSAPSMSPADCAQQLKQRFPALFTGPAKPLKLRIQVDIQQRAPGVFGKPALSAFFRRLTGSTSYLIAMTQSPHRFDLDGQPAGEISDEHREVARAELARRRANRDAQRDLDDQQRRNRAALLHDFQTTTLTPANFCALKGVAVDELDGLLALARSEAEERARQAPMRHGGADARSRPPAAQPGGARDPRGRPSGPGRPWPRGGRGGPRPPR